MHLKTMLNINLNMSLLSFHEYSNERNEIEHWKEIDIKFIFCYINSKGTQAVSAEQCVAVSSQCCGINFNL